MATDNALIQQVADRLALSGEARETFVQAASLHRFPSGMTVILPGQNVEAYLYVMSGAVRMQLVGANGRVVTLLRIEADQPCVLTTSCLLAHEAYSAEGIAELEALAATHDLVVLAAGKGEVVKQFARDPVRSAFDKPQRALALTYVHGLQEHADYSRVAFNLIPGVGETLR